jgi:hypothetical protein
MILREMLVVGLESRYKVDEISDAMVSGKGSNRLRRSKRKRSHFCQEVIINGETISIHLRRHLSASNSKKKR